MRCAFYEKEITPPLGGDIPGYYINRFTEDVADELYVRAVVFAPDTEDPAGTLAILTLDAVNVQRVLGGQPTNTHACCYFHNNSPLFYFFLRIL